MQYWCILSFSNSVLHGLQNSQVVKTLDISRLSFGPSKRHRAFGVTIKLNP